MELVHRIGSFNPPPVLGNNRCCVVGKPRCPLSCLIHNFLLPSSRPAACCYVGDIRQQHQSKARQDEWAPCNADYHLHTRGSAGTAEAAWGGVPAAAGAPADWPVPQRHEQHLRMPSPLLSANLSARYSAVSLSVPVLKEDRTTPLGVTGEAHGSPRPSSIDLLSDNSG